VRVGDRQPGQGRLRQRRAVPQHSLRVARAHRARSRAGVPLSPLPEIEWLEGGITAVPGFLAGGVTAGIKPSGKKDLALIHSPTPARSAAVVNTNPAKGGPGALSA